MSSTPPSHSPKTVLVTGARGALGSVVAARFAKVGCNVIGTFDPRAHAESGDSGIQWVGMDLADADSIRAGLARVSTPVEAWVHCAGGFRFAFADEVSAEDVAFLLDANLRSAILLARELVPGMKQRRFGRIVLISARSTLAPAGAAGMSAYVASKAGLNAFTQTLGEELKDYGITVNAVLPSIIDTPQNRRDMPQADFSKWVPPAELAELVFSLTTPQSRAINGALIPAPGRV